MSDILKLLIIEDSPSDQFLYQRFLKKIFDESASYICCETATEAINYLAKHTVDCILLDYQLPDMTGIDCLKKIATTSAKSTPVILLTGQGSEKIAVEVLKLGVFDYLIKNEINAELLHNTIIKALQQSSANLENEKEEQKIKYLAHHDSLTKLPNRFNFEQSALQAIARAKRHQRTLSILLIDLNKFKEANDTYGHLVGDLLLQETAARFKEILRAEDSIARLGGDEFIILLEEITHSEHASVVAKRLVEAVKKPFILEGNQVCIGASIGIAVYPYHGESLRDLIARADEAMYEAKKTENKNIHIYEDKENTK